MTLHDKRRPFGYNCRLPLSVLATTLLLIAFNCPAPTLAENCYQTAKKPMTFINDFGSFITDGSKVCPDSGKAKGCYEWHTKGPGRIQYMAGCDATSCPTTSGFDPKLHTCIKCKHSALDTVPSAGDKVCGTVSFLVVDIQKDVNKKCYYKVVGLTLEGGKVATADPDHGGIYCHGKDAKCGVARWNSTNSGKETSYTGCLDDCNAQLKAAGSNSTTCVECADQKDCQAKMPAVATVVPGAVAATTPAPRVLGTGTPVTQPAKGGRTTGKTGLILACLLFAAAIVM